MTSEEMTVQAPVVTRDLYRIRVTHSRGEALRYVSHLDMQMVWERTLRRAGVKLAYSQGFSPRPRLHMASALPLGFLSRCEIVDFWIDLPAGAPPPEAEALGGQIQAVAPPGMEILQLVYVPLNLPALQTQVQSVEYHALPLDDLHLDDLRQAVAALLAAPALPRKRRGKEYDLRPLIIALKVDTSAQPGLYMHLTAREGATGRPEEVLDALGLDPALFRVERTALIFDE